ncbi:DUF4365 domain-containing protein [Micromonospora carbonacea]|uniref:DUF4365 domain-containing protein n=1 Tax=Micromonospora carbonacea TaxID=47853 RepID=UPI003D75F58E
MPRRTIQHVIGSQAVAAVSAIWAEVGAAVEEVHNDYGEDLLVQTALEGRVDPFKIWIQVKGRTRLKRPRKDSVRKIRVSREHAFRWASSLDQVIIVLWDVDEKRGWYARPRQQVVLYELLTSDRDQVAIEFRESDSFDARTAQLIAWESRMDSIAGQYLVAREGETWFDRLAPEEVKANSKNTVKESFFIAFNFLRLVRFIEDDGPIQSAQIAIRNYCLRFKQHDPTSGTSPTEPLFEDAATLDDAFDQILHLTLMSHVQDFTGGVPVPLALIGDCVAFVGSFLLQGKSLED